MDNKTTNNLLEIQIELEGNKTHRGLCKIDTRQTDHTGSGAMQEAGRRGATFGLLVESEFADRCKGHRVTSEKTDVLDASGVGHSVKSTRRSRNARLLAKSYSRIPNNWPLFREYACAREDKKQDAELAACGKIVGALENRTWARELWTSVITGGESQLTRFTVYDNRGERTPEDLTSAFRSYAISDLVEVLTQDFRWEVSKKKHASVGGYAEWFGPKAASISLGSHRRRLLLFTLENIQGLLDAAEAYGRLTRLATY